MTSKNQPDENAKTMKTPKDPASAEAAETKRELTDEEIAAVAGAGVRPNQGPGGRN